MQRLKSLWRGQPVAVTLFLLALAVTLFFTIRMVMFTLYWADPARRDQEILGWMTPRYVAHSWRVPPEIFERELGLKPPKGRPLSLSDIAEMRGIPLAELVDQIEAAIAAERQKKP